MKPSQLTPGKKVQRAHVEEYGFAVRVLAVAAGGKTCGGCRHSRGDYCAARKLDGRAIEIHTPSAIACDEWSAVGEAQPVKRKRRARS